LRKSEKKIRNFHRVDCKILAFDVIKIFLRTLQKNWAATLHKVTFVWKNVQNHGALGIHFSSQVGYMLEKIQIIWNCTTYRKNIISRKKLRMIQNTKLFRI